METKTSQAQAAAQSVFAIYEGDDAAGIKAAADAAYRAGKEIDRALNHDDNSTLDAAVILAAADARDLALSAAKAGYAEAKRARTGRY